jgi:hypothetical protein
MVAGLRSGSMIAAIRDVRAHVMQLTVERSLTAGRLEERARVLVNVVPTVLSRCQF